VIHADHFVDYSLEEDPADDEIKEEGIITTRRISRSTSIKITTNCFNRRRTIMVSFIGKTSSSS
jgi:hypothetical protein